MNKQHPYEIINQMHIELKHMVDSFIANEDISEPRHVGLYDYYEILTEMQNQMEPHQWTAVDQVMRRVS